MAAHDLSAWLPRQSSKWQHALTQLLEAACYTQDLASETRVFAVEFEELRSAGLTTNDIAWLIAKGYLDHAHAAIQDGHDLPRRTELDSPTFSAASRFVLSTAGIDFAAQICPPPSIARLWGPTPQPCDIPEAAHPTVPHWDGERRRLWFGGVLIKHIKVPARNQELVLSTLEEESWPHSVDDPLPPSQGIDPKHRLHDTIIRLNRGHSRPLIRFHGNGDGRAVYWERV